MNHSDSWTNSTAGDAKLDIQVSPGASALTLSWNDLASTSYRVICNGVSVSGELSNTSISGEAIYNQSHSINISLHNSMTSVVLNNLIPRVSYNCCVSALGTESTDSNDSSAACVTSMVLEGVQLSMPVVGVIGGIAGAIIAVLIVLAIGGIVLALCKVCKAHR